MYFPAKIRENEELINACIIQYGAHRVALAGGCIRDALFNKEVKDVDIYCLIDFNSPELDQALLADFLFPRLHPDSMTDDDANLMRVYSHVKHPDCDLIFINSRKYTRLIDYFLDQYDCSICQVWYNFEYGLGMSDMFKQGRELQAVYWYKKHINRSPTYPDHRARIETKYNDWRHVDV